LSRVSLVQLQSEVGASKLWWKRFVEKVSILLKSVIFNGLIASR